MKKRNQVLSDDMRPEYDFATMKGGVRGKYARLTRESTNIVVIEQEVAAAFPTERAVNEALKGVLNTTRAVRSTYSGPSFVPGDDFSDDLRAATPVAVISTTALPIWWGNGANSYPYFEDWDDTDVIAFRGLAGSSYTITMQSLSSIAPRITVYRYLSTSPGFSAAGREGPFGLGSSAWSSPLPEESAGDSAPPRPSPETPPTRTGSGTLTFTPAADNAAMRCKRQELTRPVMLYSGD